MNRRGFMRFLGMAAPAAAVASLLPSPSMASRSLADAGVIPARSNIVGEIGAEAIMPLRPSPNIAALDIKVDMSAFHRMAAESMDMGIRMVRRGGITITGPQRRRILNMAKRGKGKEAIGLFDSLVNRQIATAV